MAWILRPAILLRIPMMVMDDSDLIVMGDSDV